MIIDLQPQTIRVMTNQQLIIPGDADDRTIVLTATLLKIRERKNN